MKSVLNAEHNSGDAQEYFTIIALHNYGWFLQLESSVSARVKCSILVWREEKIVLLLVALVITTMVAWPLLMTAVRYCTVINLKPVLHNFQL